ncbi:MmcQ/YjbR family DNA-binding protein [Amaricoccus macauensis]|uniref:MmcQ/YjbR family DNA-binding protein n=1 Tax=Amaricoccus macauensis TaxID=57001 RepID=UPI003C7C78F2
MDDVIEHVRRICLALPQATEKEAWGDPTFRIRDKIFVMIKRGDGALSAWMKAPEGAQEILMDANPALYFRPPYVGKMGWIGLRLTRVEQWDEVEAHIRRSYKMIAPRKLAAQLE